jgi:diguanylate cyclase (GGDEF)-like protein
LIDPEVWFALHRRPYATALFVGSLMLAAVTGFYAVGFWILASDKDTSLVVVTDLGLAAAGLCFAAAIWTGRICRDDSLNRVAVALMTAAFVSGLLEIWVAPERASQVTAHGCIVLLAASGVIRAKFPLIALWTAGPLGWWVVSARVPDENGFQPSQWIATWAFTALVAAGVVTVTHAERWALHSTTRSLEIAAMADPLTGLLNRRGLGQRVVELQALAQRLDQPMWCAFLDVDHFKEANDRWGHDAGDHILVAMAQAISTAARSTDLVGRWGGDEFVILGLGAAPMEDAVERRVLAHMDSVDTMLTRRWTPGVTAGVASSGGDPGDSISLIPDADHRMYARRLERRGSGAYDAVTG